MKRRPGSSKAFLFRSTVALSVLLAIASAAMPFVASASIASWQRSISMYPDSPTDFGSTSFDQIVTQMKGFGFNYVTLVIPYYQSNISSSDVGPGGNTPTDASLESAIQYVHSQGMGVALKLHLDPGDGNWRAYINANDRSSWFANYQSALMKYAQIAQQYNVEEFCIGTELISMASQNVNPDNTAQWENMIATVRGAYHGKVFYDANWGGSSFADEPPQIGFWSKLDYIGISAYYNLSGDGSVSSLESDWSSINSSTIQPLANQFGKPILFSEVGYRSVSNAHLKPWNSGTSGSYDSQEQVNDYTALFDFWNNYSYFAGVGIWYAIGNTGAGGSGNTDYLIQNKPVEQTIQQYFQSPPSSSGGSGSGGSSNNSTFAISGGTNPSSISAGQSVNLTASITDQGGSISNAIVDLEVYNSSGTQVYQKYVSGQNFSSGQNLQYSQSWTPSGSGTYTLKVGVFNSNWSTLYSWNNGAATISVGGSSSGSGGTISGSQISIWWPTNGVTVSGVQPFKALVNNLSTSQYSMYWQVDGGQLNQMQPSTQGGAHMESMVDLSSWTWRGSGPYTITFVAKDGSGSTIAQQSVQISVSH